MHSEKPDVIRGRRQGRILIVDDEKDLVLILVDTLASRGYQVEIAHSAQAGKEKIETFDAQVALLDIRLGRDSGIDLITELEEARPGILCVMMTAYAAVDTAIAALHRGAYDYLQKPLNMRYLLAALDRCFERLRLESEKAAAEEALRAQNAELARLQHLLQNITDSMPSALITLDLAGRVLTWNPAAKALTDQPAHQMRGQSLWQACPELIRYREMFERVISDGQVAHRHRERCPEPAWSEPVPSGAEGRSRRVEGQLAAGAGVVYRDVSVFPLKANDIEGAVLCIDDATRRVQLEDMMLQSAKMASVGGLAAGVAHEINNPLGAMMQSAQILQMAFDTHQPRIRQRLEACGVDPDGLARYLQERELMEYLDGIRDTGARAAKIVTDLLSFSRKSSSKVAPHDLNVLVEQTLDLAAADYNLKEKYDFRNVEIVRQLAADLPQVVCDGQQIQQVVLNLVRNAAQAMADSEWRMAHGAWRPRLTLRTQRRGEWVRLEVENNGPSVPEASRARLFEPFFTTKGVGEGTGLGLWLCWSIVVERHKGRIRVESAESGGARFVVELPIG